VQNKWVALLLLPCLGTALAMVVSGQEDISSEVVGAADKKAGSTQSEQLKPDLSTIRYDLSAIKRAAPDNIHVTHLFQPKTWNSPPPAPIVSSLPVSPSLPVPSLSPPPAVPPLIFTFLGRMIDGNDVILFLFRNGKQYTVKTNDVMDETYRVDKITNSNAVLTYLPTNSQQTLVFNSNAVGSSAMNDAIHPAMTFSFKAP
jgi:hypothetical protein